MNTGTKKTALDDSIAPLLGGAAVEPHYSDLISHVPPSKSANSSVQATEKSKQLDHFRVENAGQPLTTSHGVKIANNQQTLRVGETGPALMEDFHAIEKLAAFDRERIPERVVHARGSGAHGYFECYKSMKHVTKLSFLQNPGDKIPVFVRFSTVQGFRGSPDTVRDVRGFATKFYTEEGNFDIVGNSIPVFFIQDAIKFPDFVHAVKPEPHNEVPQGQSAHDTFWDFISLQPESLHTVFWAMSDRGIPRSYRTMEGFSVNTYKLVNDQDKAVHVKFHWKPVQGKASLIWDEAQLITGRDPDFHRKDLWDSIEAGLFPQFEFGVQIVTEEDERRLGFDILDATKLIPESVIPVEIVGKMTLNRNPDNFFAETEQIAFCPANIVPGVDFSNDPLLQGRTFSYTDTQRHRLGGPNFTEIPINRPVVPVHHHQRDGMHQMNIVKGPNYEPNSMAGNWPRETPPKPHGGGFHSHAMMLAGMKNRHHSPSFDEHFSQPRLYYLSLTDFEKENMRSGFSFELGKVQKTHIRQRVVDLLARVDTDLAIAVAASLSIELTDSQKNYPVPDPVCGLTKGDPALSLYSSGDVPIAGRRVNVIVSDGACADSLKTVEEALKKEHITADIIAPRVGTIHTSSGTTTASDSICGRPSVLADAVVFIGGDQSTKTLKVNGDAKHQLMEGFKHLKPVCFVGNAVEILDETDLKGKRDEGLIVGDAATVVEQLINVMKKHRVWDRTPLVKTLPA
ncbi:putative Catalase HPII [Blattamonas nauphoetae]|uniref:Catalase n=1 Tax=Blattamonas nauphoetae TaxID=2049346 RepID=A0ABQ9XT45_9EUKA|nr:putative Catalase HPII [Blattamonas nauphoetae]